MNPLICGRGRWLVRIGAGLSLMVGAGCAGLSNSGATQSDSACPTDRPIVCRVDKLSRPGSRRVPEGCGCNESSRPFSNFGGESGAARLSRL